MQNTNVKSKATTTCFDKMGIVLGTTADNKY